MTKAIKALKKNNLLKDNNRRMYRNMQDRSRIIVICDWIYFLLHRRPRSLCRELDFSHLDVTSVYFILNLLIEFPHSLSHSRSRSFMIATVELEQILSVSHHGTGSRICSWSYCIYGLTLWVWREHVLSAGRMRGEAAPVCAPTVMMWLCAAVQEAQVSVWWEDELQVCRGTRGTLL